MLSLMLGALGYQDVDVYFDHTHYADLVLYEG